MNVRKIVKALIPKGLFSKIEPLGHQVEAMVFAAMNGFPAKGLKVIGVTGTDGKSTTCLMIAQMLRENGFRVGLVTTVHVDYGEGEEPSPTTMTTPPVRQLFGMFKRMKANGVEWVVLETSSHALAQGRVWGVPFEVAVLTNVTHEHLDYHGTFEAYRDAKRKLFRLTNKNKRGLRVGVINADDPSAELFKNDIKRPLTYGIDSGDLRARNIKLNSGGSRFRATYEDRELRLECHIPGRFNVYNSLAAAAVGGAIGLNKDEIEKGIASLRRVPGRMERVDTGKGFEVIIDYAVTPEALKNVLNTVRETAVGRVRIVFGATGDRDKAKRPEMGRVAAEMADMVYLTDDETYTEDPQAIIDAVYEGVKQAGGEAKTKIINDRREAIETAIRESRLGDVVLITGIGHQKWRNMGGQKQPWDEVAIVRQLLD